MLPSKFCTKNQNKAGRKGYTELVIILDCNCSRINAQGPLKNILFRLDYRPILRRHIMHDNIAPASVWVIRSSAWDWAVQFDCSNPEGQNWPKDPRETKIRAEWQKQQQRARIRALKTQKRGH